MKDQIITDQKLVAEVLTRGVEEAIVKEDLEKKLLSSQKLRIKFGIDPTSPRIHLGRSIPLLKLRDFQKLGHQIVFLIGNFTGTIGDTSDKESERPMLDPKVVAENMRTYTEQAGKILNLDDCEIVYNADWLAKLSFAEIGFLADQFSVSDFIARDNIKRRLDTGKRVSLRELLYPLMQGYDSVMVKADVEVGGMDQRFNILAGRTLQSAYNQEPQNIVIGPLLEGTDGRKMSSSWGNTIDLTDQPSDMFGKVMSVSDELIIKYFTLATRVPLEQVREYEEQLKSGANPRDVKLKLAGEIVKIYHGEEAAKVAEADFIATFQQGSVPEEAPEIRVNSGEVLADLLLINKVVASKTELRRLYDEGAVSVIGGDKITDLKWKISDNVDIRVGKKRFLKIRVK